MREKERYAINFHTGYSGVYGYVLDTQAPHQDRYVEQLHNIKTKAAFKAKVAEWKAKYPEHSYYSTVLVFDFEDFDMDEFIDQVVKEETERRHASVAYMLHGFWHPQIDERFAED